MNIGHHKVFILSVFILLAILALFFVKNKYRNEENWNKLTGQIVDDKNANNDVNNYDENGDAVMCTSDARICSDGTALGRQGPKCEFAACPFEDEIVVETPIATSPIESPLYIKGKANNLWFSYADGTLPIVLKDPSGKIIARTTAKAQEDWKSNKFISFEATLEFAVPSISPTEERMSSLVFEYAGSQGLSDKTKQLVMPIGFVTYESY
jgi:hypothetical protein